MQQILRATKAKFFRYVLMAVLVVPVIKMQAQCGYASLKGQRIGPISVGAGFYTGLIEYLPADYNSTTQDYPVIVYFPGKEAQGTGSATDLCEILSDAPTALPGRIENNDFGGTVPSANGLSYIVIAVQYNNYVSPFIYNDETEDMIDYVVANYRVDESRIYLTGMSTGANMIVDYLSSSLARSQRIAAASFASLCFPTSLMDAGASASNIANGDVATWFITCNKDSSEYCGIATPTAWVNDINSSSPTIAPRFSSLDSNTVGAFDDAALNYCQGFQHDTWSAMYSPNLAPLDAGPNFYNWAIQFQASATLPVTLKNFTARFSNGKVYLNWVTASEKDNASFTIERAGVDQQYKALTTLAGSGNSSHEVAYSYVDDQPLAGLGFYRLLQTDADGKKKYFETKKVMNSTGPRQLIIASPNPFTTTLNAYITVDKKQKVEVWLTDMSGRRVATVNNLYEEGTTAISIPAAHLPKGVYVLKATGDNISETYKIIKQQ